MTPPALLPRRGALAAALILPLTLPLASCGLLDRSRKTPTPPTVPDSLDPEIGRSLLEQGLAHSPDADLDQPALITTRDQLVQEMGEVLLVDGSAPTDLVEEDAVDFTSAVVAVAVYEACTDDHRFQKGDDAGQILSRTVSRYPPGEGVDCVHPQPTLRLQAVTCSELGVESPEEVVVTVIG